MNRFFLKNEKGILSVGFLDFLFILFFLIIGIFTLINNGDTFNSLSAFLAQVFK